MQILVSDKIWVRPGSTWIQTRPGSHSLVNTGQLTTVVTTLSSTRNKEIVRDSCVCRVNGQVKWSASLVPPKLPLFWSPLLWQWLGFFPHTELSSLASYCQASRLHFEGRKTSIRCLNKVWRRDPKMYAIHVLCTSQFNDIWKGPTAQNFTFNRMIKQANMILWGHWGLQHQALRLHSL